MKIATKNNFLPLSQSMSRRADRGIKGKVYSITVGQMEGLKVGYTVSQLVRRRD